MLNIIIILSCLVSASAQAEFPLLQLERIEDFSVMSFDGPMFQVVGRADGTAMLVDHGTGEALEIRKGFAFSQYSAPQSRASAVAFGPGDTRYVLYAGPKGPVVAVYGSTGQLVRKIVPQPESPDCFPETFAVDHEGNLLFFSVPERKPQKPFPYVRKYDVQGNLVFQTMVAVMGERSQGALIAGGQLNETAVLRPDENKVHWFGAKGELLQTLSFDETVTALGFSKGELLIATAEAVLHPSVNPGVHIRQLSRPRLHVVTRTGEKRSFALPAGIEAVSCIDADGNLLQTSRYQLRVLAGPVLTGR